MTNSTKLHALQIHYKNLIPCALRTGISTWCVGFPAGMVPGVVRRGSCIDVEMQRHQRILRRNDDECPLSILPLHSQHGNECAKCSSTCAVEDAAIALSYTLRKSRIVQLERERERERERVCVCRQREQRQTERAFRKREIEDGERWRDVNAWQGRASKNK
jgi:hypothetical protein